MDEHVIKDIERYTKEIVEILVGATGANMVVEKLNNWLIKLST